MYNSAPVEGELNRRVGLLQRGQFRMAKSYRRSEHHLAVTRLSQATALIECGKSRIAFDYFGNSFGVVSCQPVPSSAFMNATIAADSSFVRFSGLTRGESHGFFSPPLL